MIGDDVDGALIRGHLADFGVELLPTITPHGTGIARSELVDGDTRVSFSESLVRRRIDFDAGPPWPGSKGASAEESGPVAVNRPKLVVEGRVVGSTDGGNRTTLVGSPDTG